MSDRPNDILLEVVRVCAMALKPLGFKKSGNSLSLINKGNLGLIEFQKSRTNDERILRFTVNLAVVSAKLLDKFEPSINKATSANAHLRLRLGMLLPKVLKDQWWEISAKESVDQLAAELSNALVQYGAPYVCSHISDDQLVELWMSGQSPGITEFQRNSYLQKLRDGACRS
ncbi:MAG: DUF4304 domain-containing protein [Hyphomicrobiaceae bacterium]